MSARKPERIPADALQFYAFQAGPAAAIELTDREAFLTIGSVRYVADLPALADAEADRKMIAGLRGES